MNPGAFKRIEVVANTASGSVGPDAPAELEALLSKYGVRASVCSPEAGELEGCLRAAVDSAPDLLIVLANYWHELGLLLDPGDKNDVETVSAVVRITGGNFRLIERLMTQVARVMDINQLDTLDPDVVHAARQILVVGAAQ